MSSDPAVSHVAVAFSATIIYTLAGRHTCSEQISHVSQAIAIINKRIANSSHTPISNGTIFAVASLTLLEVHREYCFFPSSFLVIMANTYAFSLNVVL
jgi:hypothetical protein